MEKSEVIERFRGAILGMVTGDALGMPANGMSSYETLTQYQFIDDFYPGSRFGLEAGAYTAYSQLALMAIKTGTPVIPVFSVRQSDGRYRIVFEKEITLIRTGDKTKDLEENTALFTSVIEKYVRRYPDHWFWFHRRWKTRPYQPLPV